MSVLAYELLGNFSIISQQAKVVPLLWEKNRFPPPWCMSSLIVLGGVTCSGDVSVRGFEALRKWYLKHVAMLHLNIASVLAHRGDFPKTCDIAIVCCALLPPNKEFDATAVVLDGKAVTALLVVNRCNDVLGQGGLVGEIGKSLHWVEGRHTADVITLVW